MESTVRFAKAASVFAEAKRLDFSLFHINKEIATSPVSSEGLPYVLLHPEVVPKSQPDKYLGFNMSFCLLIAKTQPMLQN
jgi:hypothetical protein